MLDFVFVIIVSLLFGFIMGYYTSKYQFSHSELCENINLIKEDVANLQVQLGSYISKED